MSAIESCPLLPSASHGDRLVSGDMTALPAVALDVVLRGALIGAGLYVAGERKSLVRYSLSGSLAIEAFVLTWLAMQRST